MPHVVALYRYPVKGFNPEVCNSLTILSGGRVAGDRVVGVRFADNPAPDNCWSPKAGMLALVNTPGLARLRVCFEPTEPRLRLEYDGSTLADAKLDTSGRKNIADVLADYVLGLGENPLTDQSGRLPLRVIGDGTTPRYHDSEAGQVTLHSRASLQAVGSALGQADFSEIRFRSNIAVDGLQAWEEHNWIGRRIRIGALEFQVIRPKHRCLATHVDPETGKRDFPVLAALTHVFPQDRPTFAVAMAPTRSGEVRVGDEVRVLD